MGTPTSLLPVSNGSRSYADASGESHLRESCALPNLSDVRLGYLDLVNHETAALSIQIRLRIAEAAP